MKNPGKQQPKSNEGKVVDLTCELVFQDGHQLTAKESDALVKALQQALPTIFPGYKLRGRWVHQATHLGGSYRYAGPPK